MPDRPPKFAVVCDRWPVERATKRKTRESAERDLAEVIKTGGCPLNHEIIEVPQ